VLLVFLFLFFMFGFVFFYQHFGPGAFFCVCLLLW